MTNLQQDIFNLLVKDCKGHQHCKICTPDDKSGCWGYMASDITKLIKNRINKLQCISTYNPTKEQFEIPFGEMGTFLKDNFAIDIVKDWSET